MANQTLHPDSALIDALGGTTKAAVFFDVTPASVSEWRRTGLPRARMMYLRLAKPEMFPERRGNRRTKSDRRAGSDRRAMDKEVAA